MTTTAIATVPTTDAGAFDADWLLQPQGEARRLEAALQSFAKRGFDGPQYTAWPTDVDGCPAYGVRVVSQAGEWSPREWVVTGTVTLTRGLWPGERTRVGNDPPTYRGGPTIWTRGRTGESVFEGGIHLADRLELPLFRHLGVIGVRTVKPGEGSLPGDELWLPAGWEYIPTPDQNADGMLYRYEPDEPGTVEASWAYVDDAEFGQGDLSPRTHAPGMREAGYLREVAYHVAGRLAGVEDPHAVYAQRQAEFEAELAAAQREGAS